MDNVDEQDTAEQNSVTMDIAQPLVRVLVLGSLRLEWQIPPAEPEAAWKGRLAARDLFLLLLCMPERQAPRSQVAGILWPEAEESNAQESLRSALKVLRRVLRAANGAVLVETPNHLLRLADQTRLWVDVDAFLTLTEQASQEMDASRALLLWQQARALWRGEWCADVQTREWTTNRWAKVRQRMLIAARRRMIIALAKGLLQQEQRSQAEELLSEYLARFPSDQDALYLQLKLLLEEERLDEARQQYNRCQRMLADLGKQPAKHVQVLETHLHTMETTAVVPPMLPQSVQVTQETKPAEENHSPSSSLTALQGSHQRPSAVHLLPHLQECVVPQQEDDLPANPSRHHMLHKSLDVFGAAALSPLLMSSPGNVETTPETFRSFASLIDMCRQLSEGNELRTAEAILWSFLPRIEALVTYSLSEQPQAASIASQGYLLAASLVGHRNDLQARLRYSEQALLYGKLAHDLNGQVVALRQMAISFDCMKRPDRVLQTYQQTLPHVKTVSPLLRACVYADIAGVYAQLGQKQEAYRFMGMAYEHFPETSEQEPGYLQTICRYSSLIQWEGLNSLILGQPHEAEKIFARIDGLHPHLSVPERVRVELLNYQIETFTALEDLDQACTYLEAAAVSAASIGSERLFQEAFSLFHSMQNIWHHEQRIQQLGDIFMQVSHQSSASPS